MVMVGGDDDYLPGMEAPMVTFWKWWFSLSSDDRNSITYDFIESHNLTKAWDEYRQELWRNGR